MTQTFEDQSESAELSTHIQNELDDDLRLQIARELRAKIESKIKTTNSKQKSTGNYVVVYNKRMLDDT